ncbi:hypothetical protein FN846DRAFT_1013843 [Sphaerosporella brunnea]|uniref:Uncharacterized protein n=1 Tax=Sphaerosporella brunnea TaxID=1250544 RepID=A0A5J5FAF5_9PEZI|nr:hypothetical protein FN846DRAFT_1013843 [Sphaerosporella brunnea]
MWSIAHHLSVAAVVARATQIAQHTQPVHLSTTTRRSVFSALRFPVRSPVKTMLPVGAHHQVRNLSECATVSPDTASLQSALDYARKAATDYQGVVDYTIQKRDKLNQQVAALERMSERATQSGTKPDVLPHNPVDTMPSMSPATCSQQTAGNRTVTEPEMFLQLANEVLKNGAKSCLDRLPAETLREYLRTLMGHNGFKMPPQMVSDITPTPSIPAAFIHEFVARQGGMDPSHFRSQHAVSPHDLAVAIATTSNPVHARFMEHVFLRTWNLPSNTYLHLTTEKTQAYRPRTVAECCQSYNNFCEWNMKTEETEDNTGKATDDDNDKDTDAHDESDWDSD